jgi:hypothetical protein
LSQSLQQFVYAEAIEDFVASGQPVTIVSQEDLDKALTSYTDELAQTAVKDIDSNQSKIFKSEVLGQEFSQKAGDQVSEFKLKLKIQVSGIIFNQEDIDNYSQQVISQIVPEGKELVSNNSGALIYEVEKIDATNHLAQIKSNISGIMVISESNSVFDLEKLKKMSVEELKSSLSGVEGIESVEVKMFPSWLKKMPFFTDHILINVNK